MSEVFTPLDEREAAEIVQASQSRGGLDIVGGGTKAGFARPPEGRARLSTAKLSGIVFHEPAEMTLRARAGAPLSVVEAALAEHDQMLPAEPLDPRPLWGSRGEPTVGGLVACALSGPRRISAGALRDCLIGVRFVNGAGEILNSGGRVTKNVTGLDLVKIHAGAHGTLGLLLEATFKLLPRPRAEITLVLRGLDAARAVAAMSAALGSPFGVSGAAARPGERQAYLRLEGFPDSVAYRAERLSASLANFGRAELWQGEESRRLWRCLRDVEPLAASSDNAIWRLSVKPSAGADIAAALGGAGLIMDWGGGLIWGATELSETAAKGVRAAARAAGGHATLMRAPASWRARVEVFEPPTAFWLAQTKKLKASLDPNGVFNLGRMYEGV